ncbi:MAG: hypothetical protein HY801_09695 [Candidatus Lindowbacteria bacterium]|nr:hypothetical protein [Candidatus Lindowbacteria bacterium]
MKSWKERLTFGALALAFLIPISVVQRGIDGDEDRVLFLRWIDNQEAYEGQLLQRIASGTDDRTPDEEELFENVEAVGSSLNQDFNQLPVGEKWKTLRNPQFDSLYRQFSLLAKQAKIRPVEGQIEWSNPDVSANVGALVLGFRKLVADLLWLKVDQYWHLGMVQRMLPTMETVVALDPHFIEAYALGAWHLAYNVTVMFHSMDEKMKYIDQGIHLLEKGVKNNPRSSKLYAELGFTMYFRKLSDWEKAAYYLGEATKYEHEPWVERAYALSLERLRQEEKALAILEDYDRRHPELTMQRFSIARIRKKLEARQLEKDGKLEQALRIWDFLRNDDPADVVAPKEFLRIKQALSEQHGVTSKT